MLEPYADLLESLTRERDAAVQANGDARTYTVNLLVPRPPALESGGAG